MLDGKINAIMASATGTVSILTSTMMSLQEIIPDGVLHPDRLFVPLGIVVSLFMASLWFTVKLVRIIDKWESTLKSNQEAVEALENRITQLEVNDEQSS